MRFLGLDSSTQSLSAIVIDTAAGQVVANHSVSFGKRLPTTARRSGFLPNARPALKHSDPLMWVEALDLLLGRHRTRAASISRASRHQRRRPAARLRLPEADARRGAPGDDRAARDQVRAAAQPRHRAHLDGQLDQRRVRARSRPPSAATRGSSRSPARAPSSASPARRSASSSKRRARRVRSARREIHLVSSFIASLLAGSVGAHRFRRRRGHEPARSRDRRAGAASCWTATAPGLARKLQPAGALRTRGRRRSPPYFVQRLRLRAGTPVVAFTGDNPCSLVGMGATAPGHGRRQPGHQRHHVRRDGGAAHRPAGLRPRVRQPGGRLHVPHLLRERLARARGVARALRPRLGRRSSAPSSSRPSPATGQPAAALLRPRRSPRAWPRRPPRGSGRPDFVARQDAGRGGPRRRRGAGAVHAPAFRLHRRTPTASW